MLVLRDTKVARSQAKIHEHFANFFLRTKSENKNSLELQKKHKLVGDEVNSNSKALRQFKFNPVLKNDAVLNSSLDLYASWPLKSLCTLEKTKILPIGLH